eukprot:GHVS01083836.1.p1 GENE.GHVS01083836.1~~GHVS01083836.1.p1  ORF type:complete len:230 (+),score=39.59 GHVS01083836.1:36-692(+)
MTPLPPAYCPYSLNGFASGDEQASRAWVAAAIAAGSSAAEFITGMSEKSDEEGRAAARTTATGAAKNQVAAGGRKAGRKTRTGRRRLSVQEYAGSLKTTDNKWRRRSSLTTASTIGSQGRWTEQDEGPFGVEGAETDTIVRVSDHMQQQLMSVAAAAALAASVAGRPEVEAEQYDRGRYDGSGQNGSSAEYLRSISGGDMFQRHLKTMQRYSGVLYED